MTGKFEIDAVLDVCGVPWRRGLRLSALRGPGPKRNENPRMAVGHTCHVSADGARIDVARIDVARRRAGGISNQI